jgi:uncharacterized protein
MPRTLVLLALVLVPLPTAVGQDQTPNPIRERYVKTEYMVPMRDGIRLYTAVYTPRGEGEHPFLMVRTPYGCAPYGPTAYRASLGPAREFAEDGYIFVYQDVRGRWASEGRHIYAVPHIPNKTSSQVDESSDAYDTIVWLIENVANHNGRVGIYGTSQPGFYASHSLIGAHPALVAVSPQAPVTDRFEGDDDHRHGAFTLAQRFSFLWSFGAPRHTPTQRGAPGFQFPGKDAYQFFLDLGPLPNAQRYFRHMNQFWNQSMQHGTYDAFWQTRNVRPHLKNVRPAVLVVGGWFDAENLFGPLRTYEALVNQNPDARVHLVMGPWWHGQWGNDAGERLGPIEFGSRTGEAFRFEMQRPFFQSLLKEDGRIDLPKARVFNTGSNVWRVFDRWPPKPDRNHALFLGPQGRLAATPSGTPADFDEFVSDPAKPVPFTAEISTRVNRNFMVEDQRFAARRADVLVYRTPPLEEDVTVAGRVGIDLLVSTTGTDVDLIVKLIDVYPDDAPDNTRVTPAVAMSGYQLPVRMEVMRGKFRNSLSRPEPFEPNRRTPVRFETQDVMHTFRRGHRLMVHVQASWFPLIDLNPQRFVNIYKASEEDFQRATVRIHRGGGGAGSRIVLPIVANPAISSLGAAADVQ